MRSKFSTKKVKDPLLKKIKESIKKVDGYGSVEIYIQDFTVTQITTRSIQKTKSDNSNKKKDDRQYVNKSA